LKSERLPISISVLLLFVLLAVVHTWPIASAPGSSGRNSTADTKLNQWAMAWVAHQVVRDPVHLFDANIFYPERRTLAYSEHLFVQSMMGAPLAWAGVQAVAVYNLVLIAGFALTGWATALVIHRWTASWLAGILSGSLMAFNALTLTRLSHIQMLHMEFFPLALLALDELLIAPRARHAIRLALWYTLQSLTSVYAMVFCAVSLAAALLARPGEWVGKRARRVVPLLALAGVLVILALLPFMWPYLQARRELEMFGRALPEVAKYSASFTDYLATGGRIHNSTWSGQYFRADGLFPGIVGFGLTLLALASGVAGKDSRARMSLAVGVAGFVLSFGPAFPLYGLLYKIFPLMVAIRGAARWGQMFLVAVALLAGFGLAALQQRMKRTVPGVVLPLCLALIVVANAEALRAPFAFSADDDYGGVPEIYKKLNTPEPEVVIIFPFYSPRDISLNARYMLVSTAFWKPLVNGYSGYMPTRYITHVQNLGGFPDARSLQYLKELGVTRVLVDSRNMTQESLSRLPAFPELRPLDTDGNLRIYDLKQ